LVVALATYWTVVLTWLPLAGAETAMLATARVDEERARRRANFFTATAPIGGYTGVIYRIFWFVMRDSM
jgi:hypothetical protein